MQGSFRRVIRFSNQMSLSGKARLSAPTDFFAKGAVLFSSDRQEKRGGKGFPTHRRSAVPPPRVRGGQERGLVAAVGRVCGRAGLCLFRRRSRLKRHSPAALLTAVAQDCKKAPLGELSRSD